VEDVEELSGKEHEAVGASFMKLASTTISSIYVPLKPAQSIQRAKGHVISGNI
jgi:hypothetical protein